MAAQNIDFKALGIAREAVFGLYQTWAGSGYEGLMNEYLGEQANAELRDALALFAQSPIPTEAEAATNALAFLGSLEAAQGNLDVTLEDDGCTVLEIGSVTLAKLCDEFEGKVESRFCEIFQLDF